LTGTGANTPAPVRRAEQIVAGFPELTDAHVRAALEFAARRERRLAESV
jgi:uncharacterized protein (DUF433 family)